MSALLYFPNFPVLRLGCLIYRPVVLHQLLTRLEDGVDLASNLPHLLTVSYKLGFIFFIQDMLYSLRSEILSVEITCL